MDSSDESDNDCVWLSSSDDSRNSEFFENNIEFGRALSLDDSEEENENDSYQVKSPEDIERLVIEFIDDINSILKLPKTTVRILLDHFKWSKEKLIEEYLSIANKSQLFEDLHITCENTGLFPFERSLECKICMTIYHRSEMCGLNCGHKYCQDCWFGYLNNLLSGFEWDAIVCPAERCNIKVDDEMLNFILKSNNASNEILQKYKKIVTYSFVENNPLIHWCPAPGCNAAIEVPRRNFLSVVCECGHHFCFSCGQYSHDPIDCKLLERWIHHSDEETKSVKWIQTNTKTCPQCSAKIEKNGGCNHMTCRKCRYEFCWVCMGLWIGSRQHACNQYLGNAPNNQNSINFEVLEKMSQFQHYNDRYRNHNASLKMEIAMFSDKKNLTAFELPEQCVNNEFLKNSVNTLVESRLTLMSTYVFGFFLRNENNEFNIFLDNQKDLENATEGLSGLLEDNIDCIYDIRSKLTDAYKYCESRCKALKEHVHEGLKKGTFKMIE